MTYEDPFAPLEFDVALISSEQLLVKLTAVTNALTREYQRRSENKEQLIPTSKKDAAYASLNIERYAIDDRIRALDKKWETIGHVLYIKSAEMRMALKV